MTEKLLPCPFCGGEAGFEEVSMDGAGKVTFSVGCRATDDDCMGYQMMAHFSRKSEAAAAWNKRAPLTFSDSLDLAQQGLDRWKAKEHNAKWWRKIDGTPIPNDLLVNIAETIAGRSTALSSGE